MAPPAAPIRPPATAPPTRPVAAPPIAAPAAPPISAPDPARSPGVTPQAATLSATIPTAIHFFISFAPLCTPHWQRWLPRDGSILASRGDCANLGAPAAPWASQLTLGNIAISI